MKTLNYFFSAFPGLKNVKVFLLPSPLLQKKREREINRRGVLAVRRKKTSRHESSRRRRAVFFFRADDADVVGSAEDE